MKHKIYNLIFISVFFLGIGVLNLLMVLTPQTTEADYEYRSLTTFEEFSISTFFNREFQDNFESAYADQFFQRGLLVKWNTRIDYLMTEKFAYLNQTENKLIPVRDVKKYNDHYTDALFQYDSSKMDALKIHANMYNEIDESIDQPIYIYKNLLLNEVDWLGNDMNEKASKLYRTTFEDLLNESITYQEMQIKDYEEYSRYFFNTDLHHTYEGAYKAYTDIIAMLRKDFPQLKNSRRVVDQFCIPDVQYRGSFARRTGFYSHKVDDLCDYSLEGLTPYLKTFINGEEKRNGEKIAYQDGYGPGYKDIYHYDAYYGGYEPEIKYDFGENGGVNALFLVDSFSNPMNDWFASHFDETYVIDLRLNKDFILQEFLDENDIDVVVVYLYYDRLFFSDEYLIKLN
ncbi:MAG: hypothetical protein ACRCST_12125 [Turicibacter sp.]